MKHTFAWSVRREVWEHPSVWIAPLAVAGFVLVAFAFAARGVGDMLKVFAAMPPEKQQLMVAYPLGITSSVILFTAFVVGVFYSLDALNTERRDRSILFWKSMPVSDTITVLSKAFVPFAVIPVVAFTIALATQAVLLMLGAAVLSIAGADVGTMYAKLPILAQTATVLYGIVVHALWYAPVYTLFLVVSALVRRPLIWVIVPAVAVQILEKIAFGTGYCSALIEYRLVGALTLAFKPNAMNDPITSVSQLDPVRFLSSPGLWLGLVAAAAFIAVAIHLRRSREPL
jgi:ABC-2 type transport system permease protein